MYKQMRFFCLILAFVAMISIAEATVSTQWTGSLESYGSDDAWSSATAARKGYNNYFYDCQFTTVELQLNGSTWMDYSPAFNPDGAGISQGIAVNAVSSVYDVNELSFELSVDIDAEGFATASLTNVNFKLPWMGATITGIRLDFTLKTTAIQQVWGDDFDSYTTQDWLGNTTAWTTGWEGYENAEHTAARRAEIGNPSFEGKVWFRDDWYGGYPDTWKLLVKSCIPDGVDSHHKNSVALNDYIVRVSAKKRVSGDTLTKANYYTFARYNGTSDNILLEIGWGAYSEKFYALCYDTAGDGVLDPADPSGFENRYIGDIDDTLPIYLTLKVEGADVTGVAEHNGGKAVMRYQTTLTSGNPGFGAEWQWGYMDALFDDFEVYTLAADDPASCGDDGTFYLAGDVNQDCQVDFLDFAKLAENWLKTR